MTLITMALVKNPDIQTHQLATVVSDEDRCRKDLELPIKNITPARD